MNNESKTSRKMAVLPTSRIIGLGAMGWITMLGIDFFLHGGLLAKLYADQQKRASIIRGPFLFTRLS